MVHRENSYLTTGIILLYKGDNSYNMLYSILEELYQITCYSYLEQLSHSFSIYAADKTYLSDHSIPLPALSKQEALTVNNFSEA